MLLFFYTQVAKKKKKYISYIPKNEVDISYFHLSPNRLVANEQSRYPREVAITAFFFIIFCR